MKKVKSLIKHNKKDLECMCQVHLRNDGDKALPCLGHGKLCPCTAMLEKSLKDTTQCGLICGDGSGKPPEKHLQGCVFFKEEVDSPPQNV